MGEILAQRDQGSAACVFLQENGLAGFGLHCQNPREPESQCYCDALYGEKVHWGCHWFQKWVDNIEMAVNCAQTLIVFYKKGQKPYAKSASALEWHQLRSSPGRDESLGRSQKGELAWIRKHGY